MLNEEEERVKKEIEEMISQVNQVHEDERNLRELITLYWQLKKIVDTLEPMFDYIKEELPYPQWKEKALDLAKIKSRLHALRCMIVAQHQEIKARKEGEI